MTRIIVVFLSSISVGILLSVLFETGGILLISLLVPLIDMLIGWEKKCVRCKRWWATKDAGSDLLKQWTEYEDVKREDIHTNREGKEVSRTTRIEQIHVDCREVENFYECKYCKHEWSRINEYRSS